MCQVNAAEGSCPLKQTGRRRPGHLGIGFNPQDANPSMNTARGVRRWRRRRRRRGTTTTASMVYAAAAAVALVAVTIGPLPIPLPVAAEDEDSSDDDDDGMKYYVDDGVDWSGYNIQPQKCINFKNEDVVVFSVYENVNKACKNRAEGTYYASVATFVQAYLNQQEVESEYTDDGSWDDPDSVDYLACTAYDFGGNNNGDDDGGSSYYLKLGCNEQNSQRFQLRLYTDEYCTTPSKIKKYYNVDISDLSVSFATCQQCITPFYADDGDDDQAQGDDDYAVQRYSPYCSGAWAYKETCNRRCQKMGYDPTTASGNNWSGADKFLLFVLSTFGLALLIGIVKQRRKMSRKDALLEEAALSVAGLKKIHVVGIILLFIVILIIFISLRLKSVTWFLLLFTDIILFGYWANLMISTTKKPTATRYGPDGTVIEEENRSQYSYEDDDNSKDYQRVS